MRYGDEDKFKIGGGDNFTQLIPTRQYRQLYESHNVLRLWLPESARQGLDEICRAANSTVTNYLTKYLVSYLYGYHELLLTRQLKTGLYEPNPSKYCMMGTKQPPMPDLGKNIFALKLYIPEQIKSDLQRLADQADIPLGKFVRTLICVHLFGRDFGPKRLKKWTDDEEATAIAWELLPD